MSEPQPEETQLMLMADLLAATRALCVQRGVNWYEALVAGDAIYMARQAAKINVPATDVTEEG